MQPARTLGSSGDAAREREVPHGSLGRKRLRVGVLQGVASWDPQHAHDLITHLVHAQIYETPYLRSSLDLEPSPRLFVGMLERAAEGERTAWTGTVRRNTLFSDGTGLDAASMVEALSRSSALADLVTLSAGDDAVRFESASQVPSLETVLAKRWCAVALPVKGGFVGTGPFMRAISPSEDRIRLVRNPHHRTVPALDEILFTVYENTAALVYAIRHGDVDFTMELTRAEADQLEHVHTTSQPGNSTGILYFNTERPDLADPEVRRALASAIDRRAITHLCHPDAAGLTARSPIPPRMSRCNDGLGFDPARARQLLASREPIGPLRLVVVWGPRPYLPAPLDAAQAIERQLRAVGIEVEIVQTSDSREYMSIMQPGTYDMVLGGWIADTEDPRDFVAALMSPDAIPVVDRPAAVTANFSRWRDPRTREWLGASRSALSASELQALVAHAADQVPFLPLMHGASVVVHTDRVRGYLPTGTAIPDFARMDLADGPRACGRA